MRRLIDDVHGREILDQAEALDPHLLYAHVPSLMKLCYCRFADFIVSGGRGLAKPENFAKVFALAKVLGAEVGASRPAVHAGWTDPERQVGQSGKTVRPKLYIAAGISGAVQHRVGMEGADAIAAINVDANAPIFDFANYALVGNALELLPALQAAFEKRLAAARARQGAAAQEEGAR